MRGRRNLKAKRKTVKRRRLFRFNKGEVSPQILIILIIVLLIFLSSMFMRGNILNPSSSTGTIQSTNLPSLPVITGGGMYALGITPLPDTYSPTMCNAITNNLVLVIDNSGSMKGTKLVQAKEAAKLFVDLIAINPESQVGLVIFNKTATLMTPMTKNSDQLKNYIDTISEGSNTCVQCGAKIANAQFSTTELSASTSSQIKRSIVLLSDGKSNHTDGVRDRRAVEAAEEEIRNGYIANSTSYYTIAIGEDANTDFMNNAAQMTGGASFSSASFDVLANTFAHVATDICTAY